MQFSENQKYYLKRFAALHMPEIGRKAAYVRQKLKTTWMAVDSTSVPDGVVYVYHNKEYKHIEDIVADVLDIHGDSAKIMQINNTRLACGLPTFVTWEKAETLYTIVAAKTFETVEGYEVQAGETGGWIEKPENLDQDGQCWVADEAIVFGGSACVKDNALVADKAVCEGSVCEDAVVRGEASIKSKAICMGHSLICDSAIVNGIVRGYATVAEKANVKEGTLVEGDTYYIQS